VQPDASIVEYDEDLLIALRFAGERLQAATQRMMMAHCLMGGELEATSAACPHPGFQRPAAAQ
jgi:hypothetical protein